jgi:hypothetical protein
MRHSLANLGRNLVAGARLALFLPVSRLAFRIDVAQLLWLFAVSAALDVATDWVRYGPDAYFSWYGAGSEVFGAGLLLLSAAALALLYRQFTLTLALPVVVLAGYPVVQVMHAVPSVFEEATPAWAGVFALADWVLLAWLAALLVRAVAVVLVPGGPRRWLRAVAGGLVLLAPVWFAALITPTEPWWKSSSLATGADPRYPNPASEPVLTAQQELLDGALADLEDERAGVTDLYFVGFAGDARDDTYRRDVVAAQQLMDERWDTGGRSVVLVNNPRTLLDTPFATVSHLRETLNEFAAAMNTDEDVAMVYLASRGNPDRSLDVVLAPLELAPLTPAALRGLLDDAGIKWRIVVVSACNAGGFAAALQDDYTAVLVASDADRAAPGCGRGDDGTFFGESLFRHGLGEHDTIAEAFAAARKRVDERERAGGIAASATAPWFVGAAMAEKLGELDRGNASRRAGRTI